MERRDNKRGILGCRMGLILKEAVKQIHLDFVLSTDHRKCRTVYMFLPQHVCTYPNWDHPRSTWSVFEPFPAFVQYHNIGENCAKKAMMCSG